MHLSTHVLQRHWLAVTYFVLVGAVPSLALDAVDVATQQIGKPYVLGTKGPNTFDCSGLTQYSYGQVGISIKGNSLGQSTQGDAVAPGSYLRGDLLFFSTDPDQPGVVTHVGIYKGNNIMIDANTYVMAVTTDDITTSYWTPRLLFARRVIPPKTILTLGTLDAQPWSGLVNYNIAGAGGIIIGQAVPGSTPNLPQGQYTLIYNGGGPVNSVLNGISPSSSQILTATGHLVFSMDFKTSNCFLEISDSEYGYSGWVFGYWGTSGTRIAQQYTATTNVSLASVDARLLQVNNPSDSINMNVYAGGPAPESGILVAGPVTMPASSIPSGGVAYVSFRLSTPVSLQKGTTYYFVLSRTILDDATYYNTLLPNPGNCNQFMCPTGNGWEWNGYWAGGRLDFAFRLCF
jgi:hypothetical protein